MTYHKDDFVYGVIFLVFGYIYSWFNLPGLQYRSMFWFLNWSILSFATNIFVYELTSLVFGHSRCLWAELVGLLIQMSFLWAGLLHLWTHVFVYELISLVFGHRNLCLWAGILGLWTDVSLYELTSLVFGYRCAFVYELTFLVFEHVFTVGGQVTIIMWGARPGLKLALSQILLPRVNKVTLLNFTLLYELASSIFGQMSLFMS